MQTFGMVPDTSVSLVRYQYRYRKHPNVQYDMNTCAGYFGKFGTTSITVPDTSVYISGTTSIPVPTVPVCISVPEPGKISLPVPDTSVRSAHRQPGTGYFRMFGRISTLFHRIVTSSLEDLTAGSTPSHTHTSFQTSSRTLGVPRL